MTALSLQMFFNGFQSNLHKLARHRSEADITKVFLHAVLENRDNVCQFLVLRDLCTFPAIEKEIRELATASAL